MMRPPEAIIVNRFKPRSRWPLSRGATQWLAAIAVGAVLATLAELFFQWVVPL